MRNVLPTVAVLASLVLSAGLAQGMSLEDVTLGDTWYGDPVTVEDMKGRVVLIEMWGRN